MALKPMGDERHESAQSHERQRSSGNGSARPLPLGLHAKMGADFLEPDLHRPALDEPKAEMPRSVTTAFSRWGGQRRARRKARHARSVSGRCARPRSTWQRSDGHKIARKHGRHRPPPHCQNRPDQKHLRMRPDPFAEQRRKHSDNRVYVGW